MFVDLPDVGPNYIRIDAHDTWSGDYTLALIIAPVIKQMRARKIGVPSGFCPDDHYSHQMVFPFIEEDREREFEAGSDLWLKTLAEIEWGFTAITEGAIDDPGMRPRVQAALQLFAKHFNHLWE